MMDPITLLTVVVLSVFVGFEVVSKVTSKLHTPLMSGANAIHGIILVGGFVVTDRMLEMFGGRKAAKTRAAPRSGGATGGGGA